MKCISLQSGVGGMDIAAEAAGWEIELMCEIDPFCLAILDKHFPKTKKHTDIRTLNAKPFKNTIDVVYGGPPCQPASVAGKRKGSEDDRWLWDENIRIVAECLPRWIVFENPYGLSSLEFECNAPEMETEKDQWIYSQKNLLNIIKKIESIGYDFPRNSDGTPIIFITPVAGVGAPHRRYRLFIVANLRCRNTRQCGNTSQINIERDSKEGNADPISGPISNDPDIKGERGGRLSIQQRNKREQTINADRNFENDSYNKSIIKKYSWLTWKRSNRYTDINTNVTYNKCVRTSLSSPWRNSTLKKSFIINNKNWKVHWLQAAADLCRMDDGLPYRIHRIKSMGNACSPQQIFPYFESINETEKIIKKSQ